MDVPKVMIRCRDANANTDPSANADASAYANAKRVEPRWWGRGRCMRVRGG